MSHLDSCPPHLCVQGHESVFPRALSHYGVHGKENQACGNHWEAGTIEKQWQRRLALPRAGISSQISPRKICLPCHTSTGFLELPGTHNNGKGLWAPKSEARTHGDREVKESWAQQASSGHSTEMDCQPWASQPFRPPHCAGLKGAPRKQGSMLPGTCATDVEETRKGEEVGATCHSLLPEQLPLCRFFPVYSKLMLGNRYHCVVCPSF